MPLGPELVPDDLDSSGILCLNTTKIEAHMMNK